MSTAYNFIKTPQPDGSELAAKIVSLLSFSVLAFLLGVKTYNVQFRYLTYSKWLVLALYVLSWAFTVISMILVTTNNGNYTSCVLSIMVCDVFYSGTKLVIYAWLIEKVYIVQSRRESRWKTMSYRFHVILMLPYIAILALMLIFHTSELEDSGICIIGLQSIAAIPLIVYDFAINLYMTIFFIKPLLKMGKTGSTDRKQSRLHQVALRTLVASVMCLVVSFANIFALQMLNGRERGLVCLTCCTVDVTINVITIHWVTSQTTRRKTTESQGETSSQEKETHLDRSSKEYPIHLKLEEDMGIHFNRQETSYGFTSKTHFNQIINSQIHHNKLNITHTEKDEPISTDSVYCSSSIHESQSSRKSLTKNLNPS